MWYCFEDLVVKKIIVQSKFNLDARFKIYRFFSSNFPCMWSSICLHSHAYACMCYSIFFWMFLDLVYWANVWWPI